MTLTTTSIRFRLLQVLAVCLFSSFAVLAQPSSEPQNPSKRDDRLLTHAGTSSAGLRRIALLIGNGAYQNTKPLKNPANDVRLLSATLEKLGFEVTTGTDRSQREMKRLIRDFGARLREGGGIGLFYFAGHGVQSKGRNFLIPVDADIQTDADLEDTAVNLNYVLENLDDAQSSLNIVILDACRNNPFARGLRSAQEGLAQVKAPTGTLIAYATGPDRTAADGIGDNSPYTEELVKQMQTAGVLLETVFRKVAEQVSSRTRGSQEPWYSANVKGDFFFSGGGTQGIGVSPPKITNQPTFGIEQNDPQKYYTLAVAYVSQARFDEAMVNINKAIELAPELAQAYAVRAGIYHFKNDLDAAIADANKALQLNLKHEAPYIIRGFAYNSKMQFDRGIEDLNKALEINPQAGAAYYGRGNAFVGKNDLDKGIADFTKAIALGSNDAQTYYNRGTAYARKELWDLALSDFNKAIELNPNLAPAYNNRAIIYEKKGDPTRAAADKKRYLELIGFK